MGSLWIFRDDGEVRYVLGMLYVFLGWVGGNLSL